MQHVVAAVLVEIDIDIRQGDTLGIQETLEQQVVFQRIYVGNFQTVGHDRSGCEPRPGPTDTPISRAARI